MRHLIVPIILALAVVTEAQGLSLEELQKSFELRCAEAANERHDAIAKLRSNYATALERHLVAVQSEGNLQKVIAVETEIRDAKANNAELPELPKDAGEGLKELRAKLLAAEGTVVRQYAQTIAGLADKMEDALVAKETELTKSGEITYAKKAKAIREKLVNSPEIVSARKLADSERRNSSPDRRLGVWRSLFEEKMQVVSSGKTPVGMLDEVLKEHGVEGAGPAAKIPKEAHSVTLCAHSPNVIRFTLRDSATKLRGNLSLLASQGDATCKVSVDGKIVYSKHLRQDERTHDLRLQFDSTKKIELIVDDNNHSGNDWVVWKRIEIR